MTTDGVPMVGPELKTRSQEKQVPMKFDPLLGRK